MSELIFISVSGPDQPGITSRVSKVLARVDANVLDIDQAVIHDNLVLGMLVELPDSNSQAVLKDLLFETHHLSLEVKQMPVSEDAYKKWVGANGLQRSIVTLVGPEFNSRQLTAVTTLIRQHKHNITSINRITSRKARDATGRRIVAVELQIGGSANDLIALRTQCLPLSSEIDLDIAVQENSVWRRNRRLVCFDMDSTLIEDEAIDLLAEAAGVREHVSDITRRTMSGELDFKQSFVARIALLRGLPESILDKTAERMTVTDGAERLVRNLKRVGLKTAIISGGFRFFAERLASRLGIDFVYANELEISEKTLTGRHTGEIIDADAKARLLREIAARQNIDLRQVIAVGDGANDLPMLSAAGLGIAFRAKPIVQAQATYAVGSAGLDAILYLIGMRDDEIVDSD